MRQQQQAWRALPSEAARATPAAGRAWARCRPTPLAARERLRVQVAMTGGGGPLVDCLTPARQRSERRAHLMYPSSWSSRLARWQRVRLRAPMGWREEPEHGWKSADQDTSRPHLQTRAVPLQAMMRCSTCWLMIPPMHAVCIWQGPPVTLLVGLLALVGLPVALPVALLEGLLASLMERSEE